MNSAELAAARRHLKEMRDLGETQRVISMAEERLRAAEGSVAEEKAEAEPAETVDPLLSLGLSKGIVDRLHENADRLEDDRLRTPEGLKAWIEEGNDLDSGLDGIGPKYAKAIKKALKKH